MYILKGFMVISPLADNTVNVIAPLGELSTQSYTYAKEKGQYTNPVYKDVILTTFASKSTVAEVSTLIPAPIPQQNAALQIGQWLYNKSELGELNSNYEHCRSVLQTQFGSLVGVIETGEMKTDTVRWLPEWISYKLLGSENEVKLWFCDESFQLQYDEYQIEFVPALEPLDSFFLDPLIVREHLTNRNITKVFQRIEEIKNKQPYTVLVNQEYEYRGIDSGATRIMTNWTVMIWGIAGNNPDVIRDELVKLILSNTVYTEDDWIEIFPDIFTSTEFILLPMWDNYAIPNRTIVTGMYSPSIQMLGALGLAYSGVQGKGYYREHVDANFVMSSILYKSLAFGSVGGPYNRDGIYRFDKKWEDYILVPSTSPDYNRMKLATQEWIAFFNQLLIVAENATLTSTVPLGMSRVIRKGVMYITSSYDRVLYLVLSRYSVQEIETNPGAFPWVEPRNFFLTLPDENTLLTNPDGDSLYRTDAPTSD